MEKSAKLVEYVTDWKVMLPLQAALAILLTASGQDLIITLLIIFAINGVWGLISFSAKKKGSQARQSYFKGEVGSAFVGDDPPTVIVKPKKEDQCVLIDDDFLIRMGWEADADEKGFKISTFANAEEFKEHLSRFEKDAYIFSDCNLGDGLSGEQLCKELHELGFEKLYLATGYNQQVFKGQPWIKGVVSKTPPF